jgi:acyl transferase domain-containing protein
MTGYDEFSAESDLDVAIIGMAGRFPEAETVTEFWQNLCDGVESVTFFSDDELMGEGIDSEILSDPNYVKASPVLEKPELFDAAFFGYSPREAEQMDPQHRLFLEQSWNALEHAGYDPDKYNGSIGVFGGTSMSTYLYFSGLLPKFIMIKYHF